MKNVLMIGSDIEVKGGISSVEKILLDSDTLNKEVNLAFLATHTEHSKVLKYLHCVLAVIKYIWILMVKEVDIVYAHMSYGASFYRKSVFALIGVMFKKRIIFHAHGSTFQEFYAGNSKIARKYISFVLNKSNKVIVLSKKWEEFYANFVQRDKLVVVYNSTDIPFMNMYNSSNRDIVFLGRLGERKGVYDILDIIPDIARQHKQVRFILAGDGDISKVKEIIKAKNLENVELPGWIGPVQKDAVLKNAGIYILPSYREGFPLSVLEAMAYGVPVITTNIGGISEKISNGEDAILIKPGDKKALKESILKLLEDENYRIRLSKSGYDKVSRMHNNDRFIKEISGILNS